jgi:hypothetical protein
MENIEISKLKKINGGKTVNEDEFYNLGRQFGMATREALATIGILLLFKI